MKGSESLF